MWIKICANTNLADCEVAIDAGADALGFIFTESKRRVTAEQAAAITHALPSTVEKVGVFTTIDAAEIERTVATAGLTMVQLHSAYDAKLIARLAKACSGAIKLMQVVTYEAQAPARWQADERFKQTLRAVFDDGAVWAVLIDASRAGASGGLGISFDWKHARKLINEALAARAPRPRVVLAGGLTPANVAEAINTLQPFGVDVVTGVEATPGRKDPSRVRAFVEAARATQ